EIYSRPDLVLIASLHQVTRPADKFFASFRFGPGSEVFVGVEAHDDRVLSVAMRREHDLSAKVAREAADGPQNLPGPIFISPLGAGFNDMCDDERSRFALVNRCSARIAHTVSLLRRGYGTVPLFGHRLLSIACA